jgi:hypothetical protein
MQSFRGFPRANNSDRVELLDGLEEDLIGVERRADDTVNCSLASPGGARTRQHAHNAVLGGPETGQTHLATAIGVQASKHHHKRLRFFPAVENARDVIVHFPAQTSLPPDCTHPMTPPRK